MSFLKSLLPVGNKWFSLGHLGEFYHLNTENSEQRSSTHGMDFDNRMSVSSL